MSANSRSTSAPWRLLVGSSISSTRASPASARQISTIWRAGERQIAHALVGMDLRMRHLVEQRARARARRIAIDPAAIATISLPSRTFSATDEMRAERQLLVDERDAAPARIERRGGRVALAIEDHLARVGLHRAGEHVHQRALPRAVLAEERVHLARRARRDRRRRARPSRHSASRCRETCSASRHCPRDTCRSVD